MLEAARTSGTARRAHSRQRRDRGQRDCPPAQLSHLTETHGSGRPVPKFARTGTPGPDETSATVVTIGVGHRCFKPLTSSEPTVAGQTYSPYRRAGRPLARPTGFGRGAPPR